MKSKVYSVLAKVFFGFAAIQAAWLLVAVLVAPFEPASTSSQDTVAIIEPGHGTAEAIFQVAPYLFLAILAGLGFYLRWLSRKCQL
jgi:hypothetical protein